ncbi:MAG: hypothetical protein EZS28_029609 [Streblomastix strix]|uniref:Uncharacterized protein n=1 Tax=Streblomastix strix TaxID=222440 RepID=A0A5J4UX76_9EUKA|nr:MAG: hypothetical protein EZS28_029609 [Streblomastix strix]
MSCCCTPNSKFVIPISYLFVVSPYANTRAYSKLLIHFTKSYRSGYFSCPVLSPVVLRSLWVVAMAIVFPFFGHQRSIPRGFFSLTGCFNVSQRSLICSLGWCSVCNNFPISFSPFECSVTVVVGVFVVNFGVSKIPKSPGSDGSGFTGFFDKFQKMATPYVRFLNLN